MPPVVDRCVDLCAFECLYYDNYRKKETKLKDCFSGFNFISGAVQLEHARELLNAHPCGFRPTHHNNWGMNSCYSQIMIPKKDWVAGKNLKI